MLQLGNLELHQLFAVPVGVVRMPRLDSKVKQELIAVLNNNSKK